VDSFATSTQYETTIYAKGALLYGQMRQILGDRAFRRLLRDYFEQNRYQIVDSEEWRAAVAALEQPELDRLYREWIGTPSLPEPTPTPTPVGDSPQG
jgi:aminopeptidase N